MQTPTPIELEKVILRRHSKAWQPSTSPQGAIIGDRQLCQGATPLLIPSDSREIGLSELPSGGSQAPFGAGSRPSSPQLNLQTAPRNGSRRVKGAHPLGHAGGQTWRLKALPRMAGHVDAVLRRRDLNARRHLDAHQESSKGDHVSVYSTSCSI